MVQQSALWYEMLHFPLYTSTPPKPQNRPSKTDYRPSILRPQSDLSRTKHGLQSDLSRTCIMAEDAVFWGTTLALTQEKHPAIQ